MGKASTLRVGDYIEWKTTRQVEVESVFALENGDITIIGRGIDFIGYVQAAYLPDAEILIIARQPLDT